MTWPPHQMTWHASKQVTSPPWNSRRLVHSKEMVWASRWSVALRTFYRQILSLLYNSSFFWNFRPRLARELLVYSLLKGSLGVWTARVPSQGYPTFPFDWTWFMKKKTIYLASFSSPFLHTLNIPTGFHSIKCWVSMNLDKLLTKIVSIWFIGGQFGGGSDLAFHHHWYLFE